MAQKTTQKKKNTTKKKTGQKRMTAAERKRLEELEVKKSQREISAVLYLAAALLIFFVTIITGEHAWNAVHNFVLGMFGVLAIPWSLLLLYFAVKVGLSNPEDSITEHVIFCIVGMSLINAAVFLFFEGSSVDTQSLSNEFSDLLQSEYAKGAHWNGSGIIGALIGGFMMMCFGLVGSRIIFIILFFVIIMLVTKTKIKNVYQAIYEPARRIKTKREERTVNTENREKIIENLESIERAYKRKSGKTISDLDEAEKRFCESIGIQKISGEDEHKTEFPDFDPFASAKKSERNKAVKEETKPVKAEIPENDAADDLDALAQKVAESGRKKQKKEETNKKEAVHTAESFGEEVKNMPENTDTYTFPPMDLLTLAEDVKESNIASELKTNGELLVKTLNDFHISTRIVDISRGPAVTRYELQPAPGVKISKITNLSDDIAMNLAASGVRIEAPIPGKSAVGIEIPNKTVSVVKARTIIDSDKFKNAESKLTVALGKDITGSIALADISKMPHLLIAGSTGSGKSVCINSIITSILYKSSPEEVKLLMVDPKVVELGIYNGIPHLIVPVVTDPKKAASALAWAVSEMLKRYEAFAENNVRDIRGFNKLCEKNEELKKLPQIVIIIDELADLMMVAKKEVEDYIGRLTQMARAAGMHLIVATQRPSVDVITGVIKANIPSRIAFAVSSQVDSRTILDSSGAEKLIGRGDMLFMPVGANKPTRIQGCFVTDEEIENVVTFIKNSSESNYDDEVAQEIETKALENSEDDSIDADGGGYSEDPMFEKAVECVLEAGQASTSLLQRRLRLGYARAGRLIDELENAGIVGPHEGSKPRQVIITSAQWMERKMTMSD